MTHEDIIRDLEISRAENELKLSIRSNDKDFYMQNLSAINKAVVHIKEQKRARDKELIIAGVIAAQLLIVVIGLLISSCTVVKQYPIIEHCNSRIVYDLSVPADLTLLYRIPTNDIRFKKDSAIYEIRK